MKILLGLLLFSQMLQAQLLVENNSHDFGTLQGDDKRYADFIVVNAGKTPINLLRIETFRDRELQTKISDVYLLSTDTAVIRVQINPLVEGKFNKKFELYTSFSSSPIDFKVKGETKNLNDLQRQSCPDFNNNNSAREKAQFEYTVLVKDALTGEAIKTANVSLDQVDYGERDNKNANRSGECSFETNPGRVEIQIKANGYESIVRREFLKRSDRLLEVQMYTNVYVETGKYESPQNKIKENESRIIADIPAQTEDNSKAYQDSEYGSKEINYNADLLDEKPKQKNPKTREIVEEVSQMETIESEENFTYGSKNIDTSFLEEEMSTSKQEDLPETEGKELESKFELGNSQTQKKQLNQEEIETNQIQTKAPEIDEKENRESESLAEKFSVNTEPEEKIEVEITDFIENEKVKTSEAVTETEGFEESKFKANNVVFLIDKSVSMGNSDKLEITKKAVLYLINRFRPIDQLGVVVYDTDARILIPSANGSEVKKEQKQISDLSASGKTYGAKGLQEALQMDEDNYIENGVNQIFIITDGGFSEDIDKVKRVAKRCAKKNIQLHFIGVKNQKYTERAFKQMARLSNGDYIHLQEITEAEQQLFDYIKNNSSIK